METQTSTIECADSPDGKHCWHHDDTRFTVNEVNETCCWCGASKGYVVNIPFSYTVLTAHGPHVQTKMIV